MPQRIRTAVSTLSLLSLGMGIGATNAFETIPEALHEQCLQAADYLGCVKANSNPAVTQQTGVDQFGLPIPANSVPHQRQDGTVSYFNPDSIAAVRNKGSYGRYITWTYTYHYIQKPTAGYWTPGYQQCSKVGTIKTCRTVGQRYIPGTPGGPRSTSWRVYGDCVDYTAKWVNDGNPWQKIHRDSRDFNSEKREEAREVMNNACPRIDSLPRSGLAI